MWEKGRKKVGKRWGKGGNPKCGKGGKRVGKRWELEIKCGKRWERVRAGPDLKAVRKVWPQALLASTGQNKGERCERGRLGGGGEKVGNLRRESWEK